MLVKANTNVWTTITESRKRLIPGVDLYVLGSANVKNPAVLSRASIKGVKARLVSAKKVKGIVESATPIIDIPVDIIAEWDFDEDRQEVPVYIKTPITCDTDVFVQAMNPTTQDAIVSALITGEFRGKK